MKHFLPIFRALEANGVRYVAVGGIAAIIHGVPRMTGDIDLIIDFETKNCERALKVMENLGFVPRAPVALLDFAKPDVRRSWVKEKGMVVFSLSSPKFPVVVIDLFTQPPLQYNEISIKTVAIEECEIFIASIEDLITMKNEAGREKDREDVRILQQVSRERETM
ncbi:nucleotidyltransferase family protein [bacterium]|nr:nucleotidyltransferase family protein [bacterium]